ncbi:MAG: gliding motility-associated C-terminal domain-containing protein, partial [Flavobacteriales bacterium]
ADNSFGGTVEGTYTLSASDDCGQNLSVDVEWVACDTEVPNVFTPGNTDASNDFFVIDGLAGFPGSRLTVFNRWGNVVYEAEDYQNEWNGADMGGSDLSQGTYYWVFERSDGENFSGYVMILRD